MREAGSVPPVVPPVVCHYVITVKCGAVQGPRGPCQWGPLAAMVPLLLLASLPTSLPSLSWSAEPWSPLSPGGQPLQPPLIPRASIAGALYTYRAPRTRLVRPNSPLNRRRKWRRRRRYWRDPRAYRRFHSSLVLREVVRPRRRQDRKVEAEEGRGFVRNFRNLFGAPDHCLEEGRQYSCTFAPVCWLTGGVAGRERARHAATSWRSRTFAEPVHQSREGEPRDIGSWGRVLPGCRVPQSVEAAVWVVVGVEKGLVPSAHGDVEAIRLAGKAEAGTCRDKLKHAGPGARE